MPNVMIGQSVTNIGASAFNGCKLTSILIPDSVVSIGNGAFYGCGSLTNISFGDNLTSIGDFAFQCSYLNGVVIPNSVRSLGNGAFTSSVYMSRATIYGGYGTNTFSGCGLTNVVIGTNVTRIGPGMFQNCTKLANITIPSSVTNIENTAFQNCSSLTDLVIGTNVTTIGVSAFQSCSKMLSVTIPASVRSIGSSAFSSCTSLTGVYFMGNAPSGSSSVFSGDNNATVYYQAGTLGWGPTFGGRPTAPWPLPYPVALNEDHGFGLQTNGFGFTICWNTNVPVVVESCTILTSAVWYPVGTNTLTNGLSYFSDPQWTNYPARFYRLRSP
jgi:hypothetical protein